MRSLEEEYLNIIQRENEVIEEGKLINSLLASTALFSSMALHPPKVSAKTIDSSGQVQLANQQKNRRIKIGDDEVDEILLSKEERYVAEFIYLHMKGSYEECKNDAYVIAKTLATRFIAFKEGSTPYEMVKNISSIDVDPNLFVVNDKLTYDIAQYVKKLFKNPEDMAWKERNVVWYAKKGWDPSIAKNGVYVKRISSENYDCWLFKAGETNKQEIVSNLTKDEEFLARVIYSETSTICTPFEVKLVCKVIMNRIRKKGFCKWWKDSTKRR